MAANFLKAVDCKPAQGLGETKQLIIDIIGKIESTSEPSLKRQLHDLLYQRPELFEILHQHKGGTEQHSDFSQTQSTRLCSLIEPAQQEAFALSLPSSAAPENVQAETVHSSGPSQPCNEGNENAEPAGGNQVEVVVQPGLLDGVDVPRCQECRESTMVIFFY